MQKKLLKRRYYIAVEGEGEQSFIKFIQFYLSDVHLECHNLNGGGYKKMLEKAIRNRKRLPNQNLLEYSILLIDTDRADRNDDDWTIEKLRQEAEKNGFIACFQKPNLEGIFYRMLPGNEQKQSKNPIKSLQKEWKNYQKPADFNKIRSKFNHLDLIRASKYDKEIKKLLDLIKFDSQCIL